MNLLLKTMLAALIFGFLSCGNTPEKHTKEQKSTKDSIKSEASTKDRKVIVVTYESAAVYAAVTEYGFRTESGELLLERGDPFGEKPTIVIPDNMLEDDKNLEGPPGANPALVGKKFKLHYKNDVLYRMELAE